jgi:hypothetical protein
VSRAASATSSGKVILRLPAVDGIAAIRRSPYRSTQRVGPERLRGLHRHQAVRGRSAIGVDDLGEGYDGQRAALLACGIDRGREQVGPGQRASPVVHRHHVDRAGLDLVRECAQRRPFRGVPRLAALHDPDLTAAEVR